MWSVCRNGNFIETTRAMREAEAAGGAAPAPRVPPGLPALLEGLSREVLKANPTDIYAFCAQHFEKLLKIRDDREGSNTKTKMTLEQKIAYVQNKLREKAEKRHNTFINLKSEINVFQAETESNESERKDIIQTKIHNSTYITKSENDQDKDKSNGIDKENSKPYQAKEDNIKNGVTKDGEMVENVNRMDKIKYEIQEKSNEDKQNLVQKQENIENYIKEVSIISHNEEVPIEGHSGRIPPLAEPLTEEESVDEVILKTDDPVSFKVNKSNEYVEIMPKNMVTETIGIEYLKEANELAVSSIVAENFGQAPTESTSKEENVESLGDINTHHTPDSNHCESALQITEVEVRQNNNGESALENDNSDIKNVEIIENSSEMKNLNECNNESVQIEDINSGSSLQINGVEVITDKFGETNDESNSGQIQQHLRNDNYSEEKELLETLSNEDIKQEELEEPAPTIVKIDLNESVEPKQDSKNVDSDVAPNEEVKEKLNIQNGIINEAHIEEEKSRSDEHYNAVPESNISNKYSSTITENESEMEDKAKTILDISKDFEVNNFVSERNENHVDKHFHEDEIDLEETNTAQNTPAIPTELGNSNITVLNDIAKHEPDIVDSGMLQNNVELLIVGNSENNYEFIDSASQGKEIEVPQLNQMENATLNKYDQENISASKEQTIEKEIVDVNFHQEEHTEHESSENNNEDVVKPIVNSISMDLETAAITIQKVFRAFLFKSRASTSEENTNDGNSIEISDPSNKTSDSEGEHLSKGIGDDILGIEEKVPGALVRMNTVLQTVNEEKSLSLSTDESLSSAATVIQAHVRGFLVRNRRNSNKLRSSDTTAASDETLNMDTPRAASAKTVLNINIREQENFVSTGDSLETSMDLPTDPGGYVVNLHPLGYDKDARKRLIREDAIQSMSPPSNGSFNSPKEMSIEQTENKTLLSNNSQLDNSKEDIIKEDAGKNEDKIRNELEKTDSMEINATQHEKSSTGNLINSDETDVVTPFHNENSEPNKTVNDGRPGLLHSSEFHDVVLPTRVVRNDSTIVRGE